MNRPGHDWKVGKPKFPVDVLEKAVIARLKGAKLSEIEAQYGIHGSYVSKLMTCSDNCGGQRYRQLPKKLRRILLEHYQDQLLAKLGRIEEELAELEGSV
jgi:hypothetical protein